MSDLKPCPFCGCNAGVLEREQLNGPILYKIVCNSKKCRGHDSAGNVGSWMENGWRESREEAAELWNRRSERTCELELDEYENVIRCTSCGHEECNPCSNDCMYGNAKYKWKYCPNCGARVVSDDADRFRDATKIVDRYALLALADEMDELCGPWHDCGKHYASRIREACGEAGR